MCVHGFGVCISVIVIVLVFVCVCTRMSGHAATLAGVLMCWQRQNLAPFASPLVHLAWHAMFALLFQSSSTSQPIPVSLPPFLIAQHAPDADPDVQAAVELAGAGEVLASPGACAWVRLLACTSVRMRACSLCLHVRESLYAFAYVESSRVQ